MEVHKGHAFLPGGVQPDDGRWCCLPAEEHHHTSTHGNMLSPFLTLLCSCPRFAAGRWELALELFSKMHKENCKPNVVTYNSLIAACAHGGCLQGCAHGGCLQGLVPVIECATCWWWHTCVWCCEGANFANLEGVGAGGRA